MTKCTIIGRNGNMAKECLSFFGMDPEFNISANFHSTNPVSKRALSESDSQVVIDCSVGEVFLNNLETYLKANQVVVVISSGWYGDLEKVRGLVKKYQGRLFYADNYAIGSFLFKEIIKEACQLIKDQDFDISLLEKHHINKKDYPSAVALKIADIVIENTKKQQVKTFPNPESKVIQPEDFCISSYRVGSNSIDHEFYIASDYEDIKIAHSVRDRKAFMKGIKTAIEFVLTKPSGVYDMQDLIG